MELRRILYPVEFTTDVHHGLDAAAALARKFDGELILAHAISFPYPYMSQVALDFDIDAYYREMEEVLKERLEKLLGGMADELSTRSMLMHGDPASAIVDAVDEHDVDLVVMPTHGRSGFQRLLVGSVTEKVVRLSPAPVLTIPPVEEEREFHIERILVPTDFSDRSDKALGPAISVARAYDADILMLHVVTIGEADPANPDWGFPAVPEEHIGAAVKVAEEQLDSRIQETPDKVEVGSKLVRGFDAAEEIVRVAAEEDIDLVVMSTHGHTGLMHVLLGSTAGKVIRHTDRPILTVRVR